MIDRCHDDLNAKARAIIDDAIAELFMLGMDSRDSAASMMAVQAMVRIDDPSAMEGVAAFATSLIVQEDGGGG